MASTSTKLLGVTALATALVVLVIALSPKRDSTTAMVAVTSYPLLDIVRSVAGSAIVVESVMPPGANPHSFEPSLSTVEMLSRVHVLYAIGHGFDDWIDPVIKESSVRKVVVDTGVSLRTTSSSIADEKSLSDDVDGPVDPHYWLDARNAVLIAQTVAADLITTFPDQESTIKENLRKEVEKLTATDVEVRAALANIKNKKVVTLHDAWYYFAEAYGLEIIGSFEPTAAREPSPQYLTELENAVRASGASMIYTEPGVASAAIVAFAKDNGLKIVELDPLEGATKGDYNQILRQNAKTIGSHQR